MMQQLFSNPYFGLLITILVFYITVLFLRVVRIPLLNPLALTLIIMIAFLAGTHIRYDEYYKGGVLLNLLITPATVVLAVPLYKTFELLKKNFVMVIFTIAVTTFVVCIIVAVLAWVLGFSPELAASMMPKSVTTAIAVEVSKQMGGNQAITIIAVIITGIVGMTIGPTMFKILRIKDPLAKGLALGCSAHAMGTVKAMEIGEVEGAMSGVAMSISGILVVFIAPAVYSIFHNLFKG